MKVGVFGGTFDPFTVAHRAIAEEVLKQNLVDKVIILPTIVNYYKKNKVCWLTPEQKIDCIVKMLAGRKYSGRIEINQYEFSLLHTMPAEERARRRSVHMIKSVRELLPSGTDLYYIIGTDSLKNIKTWYMWQDLLKMIKLIAVTGRNGENVETDVPYFPISIPEKYRNISSTDIRRRFGKLDEYLDYIGDLDD